MMSSPRRPSLSTTQVAASVLATLTGAIAASSLGVASTLVGAAVGSIASTVGTEVYRHYLGRTQERLHGAVVARRYRSATRTVVQQANPASAQNRIGVTSHREAAAAETEILPAQRPGGPAREAGAGTSRKPTSLNDPVHDAPTQTFATANSRSQGVSAGIPAADGAAGAAGGNGGKPGRPRWLVATALTAGAFVVAVIAITLLELGVGKPLDALLWNKHSTGTTVGGAVGGHQAQPTPTQTAPASPSAVPTTPSPSVVVSPTPTPSTSAGTPTGSSTPSPGGPLNSVPTATSSP
jgi:hypothetical protein